MASKLSFSNLAFVLFLCFSDLIIIMYLFSILTYLSNPIYLRMLGYTATLAVHSLNVVHMLSCYKEENQQDPDVAYFLKYQYRLLTIWNVIAQMIYAALGLSCDVLSLANERKHSTLLKTLNSIRDPLFSAVVFPISMTVSTMFWVIYSYEPTFILPSGILKTVSSISNHVLHTFILPVVFWEIAFRPRKAPASHILNKAGLFLYSIVFIAVLYVTHHESRKFPYPILNMIYGTPYFYGFLATALVGNHIFYKLQWHITEFLWDSNREESKKMKKYY